MRWFVEVSSTGKTDVQKFCVEAESWQRALQAARAQRGEEGPMSGFAIELLEEGYRAADPVSRIRFVVKRAPDDAPITAPLARDAKGVAPSPPSIPPPASGEAKAKSFPPASAGPTSAKKSSVPPRPSTEKTPDKTNGPARRGLSDPPPAPEAKADSISPPPRASAAPPAAPAPAAVGSAVPGLPPVKVLSAREQNPTEASPLTYREYSFAVPPGTSEDVAANVLRAQLKLVDAHIESAKMGKLVNLAVFDVEFTGKPPGPPIATLTWKDWKGDPVVGYPRRGAGQKQIKPPSHPPASQASPTSQLFPPSSPLPPGVRPAAAAPAPASVPPPAPAAAGQPRFPPPTSQAIRAMVAAAQIPPGASAPPGAVSPSQPPAGLGAGGIPVPVVAPVGVFTPVAPASRPPPAPGAFPPAAATAPATTASPSAPPPRRASAPAIGADGMIRTPSGRFVRGRTTGDELITALFESMHDLHFLRDALDGGQFCLALATEVLPSRAAIIHFFDIEKREWVVACTRGKDANKLLTLRTPEKDEILRDAARKRRALVLPNGAGTSAQRYQSIGGSRSMIIAPIMQAGRALGAIEIINPLDGMPFTDDEGNAMTYIAEQYAEYLGSRGIVVDRDRIQAAAGMK